MPFFHLTTHIEGDKYQDLLKQKGGRGFPTLVFMDAEGNVLAEQGERSVKAFTKTLNSLKAWQAAKQKAAGGVAVAKKELFLAELDLGKLSVADARTHLKELTNLSKDETATVEDRIRGLEVKEILEGARTPADMAKGAEKLLAMHPAGNVPSGQPGLRVYGVLISQTVQKKDWKLCDELLAALRTRAKGDANGERMSPTYANKKGTRYR